MATTLKTEQNTTRMDKRIRKAFRESSHYSRRIEFFNTAFEHGQWWVIVTYKEGCEEDQRTFSVVDVSGPGTVDGFDFEEV